MHEGVADRRTNELEAAFLEVLAHGVRLGRRGGNVFELLPLVADWLAVDKLPDVSIERVKLVLNFQKSLRISHR